MNTTTIAILTIGILACVAMLCGFDGVFLATALAAISGLGGYDIKKKNSQPKQ
jgi:hypothetical protein